MEKITTPVRVDNSEIKALMAKKSLTKQAFADKIGISIVQLRSKLSGKQRWWVDEIITIAAIFGVDYTVFFTQSDTKM